METSSRRCFLIISACFSSGDLNQELGRKDLALEVIFERRLVFFFGVGSESNRERWRRVDELESGVYVDLMRLFFVVWKLFGRYPLAMDE